MLKKPCERAALEVQVSSRLLREGSTYDAAAVRIRAADENGNLLPYYQEPIILKTEGEIELIGPDIITLRGGYGGTYVRTTGKPGMGRLYINDLFIDFKCE